MSEPTTNSQSRETQRQQESDCCSEDYSHSLTESAVATDVELLATLGNDTRYEALRLISEADDDICVCEIEPALGVSQGAVSQALSRLFSAGLVERRKEGRWRYYTVTSRAERLLRILDETRIHDND